MSKKCRYCNNPAEPGRTQCQYHLDMAKARALRHRQLRKRQGICHRCNKNPARPGVGTCQSCHERQAKQGKKDYRTGNHIALKRKAQGLCTLCGKEAPPPGFVACDACRAIRREKYLRQRMNSYQMQILERDNRMCQLCGRETHLVVHHIDGQGKDSGHPNDDFDNLITLCKSCHSCLSYLRSDLLDRKKVIWLISAIPSILPSIAVYV